jgi:O-antigen ligase
MNKMKALIIVLLLVILAVSVNAQSKSHLNQEQLNNALKKAKTIKRTGAVITISGCVLDVTGIVLLATSPVNGHRYSYFFGETDTYDWRGGYVLLTGVVLSLGGIPPWVIGGVKKIHAENKLAELKVSASFNGIGLKIRF